MSVIKSKQICVFDNDFSDTMHETFCGYVLLYKNKSLTLHYQIKPIKTKGHANSIVCFRNTILLLSQ